MNSAEKECRNEATTRCNLPGLISWLGRIGDLRDGNENREGDRTVWIAPLWNVRSFAMIYSGNSLAGFYSGEGGEGGYLRAMPLIEILALLILTSCMIPGIESWEIG